MFDMSWIHDPNAWVALATLTVMEIVLGIDNIIFIAILAGRLPEEKRDNARRLGLILAMVSRIGLLFSISWLLTLQDGLFSIMNHSFSGKDLILITGGLFLLGKATHEIHEKMEGEVAQEHEEVKAVSFTSIIIQIGLLDIVFSIDSVITAVGMAKHIMVMVLAVVLSVLVMLAFSGVVSRFVDRHPTVKVLALSFLMLIGLALVAEGWHFEIPKGYIYFAMGFSAVVEGINLKVRSARKKKL